LVIALNGPRLANLLPFALIATGNKHVNDINPTPLSQESPPVPLRAPSENDVRVSPQDVPLETLKALASTETPNGQEAYERGTTLKNVGLFSQAAEHFEKAAQDPAYALKGFAQMGFSLKQSGKLEDAAVAFRRALQMPSTSSKEQIQILYLLGRTLESLERIPEALEAYRWLRREAPQYRDVAIRIESLSMRRAHRDNGQRQGDGTRTTPTMQLWHGFLRSGK
jgi:tetratricopeptide (TPR) repeat protein